MQERSVLVVDDESLIRWALAKEFSTQGYSVETAVDCATARQWLLGNSYRVCFVGIHLPDGNGLDLAAWIREAAPRTRVVVISGDGSAENKRRAFRSGVWQFVDKPFELPTLSRLLAEATTERPERRVPDRHLCRLSMRVSAIENEARESPLDLHNVLCESVDFSRDGLGLRSGYPLRAGQEVRVEVLRVSAACADFVPEGSTGRVVWSRRDPDGCRAGLRLMGASTPGRTS